MNMQDNYKRCIEEIVGPIGATPRRKNIMRRELWAHFQSLAHEEGDGKDGHARAWARMGNASEIRRELDASVPKRDRAYPQYERYIVRDLDEPFSRFALRFAGLTIAVAGSMLVLALAATLLLSSNHPTMRATVVFCFLVSFFGWLYSLMLLIQPAMHFSRDFTAQQRTHRPALVALRKALGRMLIALLVAPLFWLLGYTLLGLTLGFRHTETLSLAYMWPLACGFAWVQITGAIAFAAWYEVRQADVIGGWPYAQ